MCYWGSAHINSSSQTFHDVESIVMTMATAKPFKKSRTLFGQKDSVLKLITRPVKMIRMSFLS